jgi:hypothetical protein
VTFESARLTRWPAVPLKRSWTVSPELAVVTVTGGPPGVIENADFALPMMLRVAELEPAVAVTENVTAPRALGVKVPV